MSKPAALEVDYLDVDDPIRGQNYVCLSFLSPEDMLKRKDLYYFEQYMKNFATEMRELFDGLEAHYPEKRDLLRVTRENTSQLFDSQALEEHFSHFKTVNEERIEKEFHEQNQFRPTVRGIKVRGVFDAVADAKRHVKKLKDKGDAMDIYVAEMGTWCAWSPNPNNIVDQEYANAQLNEMMKKMQESTAAKDLAFEERKQARVAEAAEAVAAAKQKASAASNHEAEAHASTSSAVEELEKPDAWMERSSQP